MGELDPNFLDSLEARGLVQDTTDRGRLKQRLSAEPITVFCGFDPSAASLHVGNLIGLLILRRFQLAGHNPIALSGGATGMVGDPSGRSDERNMLNTEILEHNLECIQRQLALFLDFDAPNGAQMVDNNDWFKDLSYLDFLRSAGKHITINQMIAKDSVRSRFEGDSGISYTEFSYMLMQGYDFWWQYENLGCELQIGGSDQWGNITAGCDLIRKMSGGTAFALTHPLLTKPDGSKYGKTAGGETLWLDPEMMSPYQFYQYWIQVEDSELSKLFSWLTLLDPEEIREIVAAHEHQPSEREGQARLASEVTAIVHGSDHTSAAAEATRTVFGDQSALLAASPDVFDTLSREIPFATLPSALLASSTNFTSILVDGAIAKSKGEASRLINQGGVKVNGQKVAAEDSPSVEDLLHGRFLLVRKGKKAVHLLEFFDQ